MSRSRSKHKRERRRRHERQKLEGTRVSIPKLAKKQYHKSVIWRKQVRLSEIDPRIVKSVISAVRRIKLFDKKVLD